jgi:uncharacterized membrane protein YphA (DoxX/SURF4 family)
VGKPEYEFFDPLRQPPGTWRAPEGDRSGQLSELVLAADLASGDVTRLLRFAVGADTSVNGTLSHDFWEEVWILEGALHDLRLDRVFDAGSYACRPPGMPHGPWRAPAGALTLEIRYRRDA